MKYQNYSVRINRTFCEPTLRYVEETEMEDVEEDSESIFDTNHLHLCIEQLEDSDYNDTISTQQTSQIRHSSNNTSELSQQTTENTSMCIYCP